ncbi:MAG: ABC transporter permease [Gemmatimonadetes bacterium]|nr:ABC transporter permease [Gemmatimonadota bacterium]
MSTLLQDLRYGLRMLARAPVVSAVAVLSLGVGIAANAMVFSMLNAFMLKPLPYHEPDRLVLIGERRPGQSVEDFTGASVGNFRDYEAAAKSLNGAMLYTIEPDNLTGLDVPEQLRVVVGTPNIFDVLGVQPALGRGFRPSEGTAGAGDVLVLTHDFWERRFLGDPNVLGRSVTLDGTPYTVVGVMPETFDMIPANVQAFRPSDFAAQRENRASRGYIAFGRLAPGATPEQAQREIDPVAQRLADQYPDANRGWSVSVIRARDFFPGPTDEKLVLILTVVALFGLLIACANVANLLLSRAEERQKEVAVRTALGAGRGRILRQLLTESVALGVAAGVLGILITLWGMPWLQGAMPAELPKAMIPRLDPVVLAATVAVSILAGIAFGLAPALHSARAELRESLGEGSRGGTASRTRRRMRNAFVVGEFAVALALLTGARLLTRAFDTLTETYPGFHQAGLLTFTVTAEDDRYPKSDDLRRYEDELLLSLKRVPGLRGVAAMSSLPRGRSNPSARYTVDGRPAPEPTQQHTASLQTVNPEYFTTMGIPLLQGRGIGDTDREGGQKVAVVSKALVAREFPGEDPLGKSITVRGSSRMIVGVAGDILQDRIAIAGRGGEAIYLPLAQEPSRMVSFALRFAGDPALRSADVRRAVWAVNPDQPVAELRTLDAYVAESLAGPRAIATFLNAMVVIALALAAMGIYGVLSHAVAQQRREIGIRMALGAGRRSVVGMVTRSGVTLAGLGMVLGLPLAWLMSRAVESALSIFDSGATLAQAAGVAAMLAVVALVSTWIPARRASGVDPQTALRQE